MEIKSAEIDKYIEKNQITGKSGKIAWKRSARDYVKKLLSQQQGEQFTRFSKYEREIIKKIKNVELIKKCFEEMIRYSDWELDVIPELATLYIRKLENDKDHHTIGQWFLKSIEEIEKYRDDYELALYAIKKNLIKNKIIKIE